MNANYRGGNANSSQGQVQTQAEMEVKGKKAEGWITCS